MVGYVTAPPGEQLTKEQDEIAVTTVQADIHFLLTAEENKQKNKLTVTSFSSLPLAPLYPSLLSLPLSSIPLSLSFKK